jgi:hypothetical protein
MRDWHPRPIHATEATRNAKSRRTETRCFVVGRVGLEQETNELKAPKTAAMAS